MGVLCNGPVHVAGLWRNAAESDLEGQLAGRGGDGAWVAGEGP